MPTYPSLPRLDLIIVNWNHGTRLSRCLASLEAASRDGFVLDRVVIVDNASSPPLGPLSAHALPLTIVQNDRNEGFAAACMQGAEGSQADYLLFLNPDTRVAVDALAAAVAALEREGSERTGILGLPLVDDRGVPQPTCGRFLTVGGVFNQVTGLALLAPAWFPGLRLMDWDHRQTSRVDFVSGACLLVRRHVFEQVGGFDPRFVVYLEDADLALRARRCGWDAVFLAGPPVYHEGGWGTGTARSLRLAHTWRSLLMYGRKHLGIAGTCGIAAIVFGLAPAARAGQAVLNGSPRELLSACFGYARLWWLVLQDAGYAVSRPRGYNDAFYRQDRFGADSGLMASARPPTGRRSRNRD